jgi:hypothetical protein
MQILMWPFHQASKNIERCHMTGMHYNTRATFTSSSESGGIGIGRLPKRGCRKLRGRAGAWRRWSSVYATPNRRPAAPPSFWPKPSRSRAWPTTNSEPLAVSPSPRLRIRIPIDPACASDLVVPVSLSCLMEDHLFIYTH